MLFSGNYIIITLPILNTIINILKWIAPFLVVEYSNYITYLTGITFYKEANPNE